MATEIIRHYDPAAVGTGDGTSKANAYTTIAALVTAEEKNLVSADEELVILMNADSDQGGGEQWFGSSWVTDATRRIIFRAAAGLSPVITSSSAGRTIRSYTNFIKSEGVSIRNTGAGNAAIQYISITGAAGFEVSNATVDTILPQNFDPSSTGNVIKGVNATIRAVSSYTAYAGAGGLAIDLFNCVIADFVRWDDYTTVTVKNTAFPSADAFLNGAGGGLSTLNSTNCLYAEAVSETFDSTTNDTTSVDFTGIFTDAANLDYTLIGTPSLMQTGIGPASDGDIPTTDYEGDSRAGTIAYIGIDEVFDGTDPVFSSAPAGSNQTSAGFRISATLNEAGTAQALVTAQGSGQPSDGSFDASTDTASVTEAVSFNIDITGQTSSTTYTVWVRGLDNAANAVYASVDVTTTIAAPVISAVSSTIADNATLTIDGSNLDLATDVTVGGVSQFANILAQSASQITLTFDRASSGNGIATVVVTDGTAPSSGSTTIGPVAGYAQDVIAGPVTDSTSILYNFSGTALAGHVIEAPVALSVNPDGTFSTDALGGYTVNYYDGSAWSTAVVTVSSGVVVDTIPPVITLVGGGASIGVGGSWVEPGFSATDNTDGVLTSSVVVGGQTVDVNTIGSYTITYNVTDAAGNGAQQVTRTITVVAADSALPVITLTGGDESQIEGAPWWEKGYEAFDGVDGDITNSVVVGGQTVDISTPSIYIITYDVTDAAGNVAIQVTRTVTITEDVTTPGPVTEGLTTTIAVSSRTGSGVYSLPLLQGVKAQVYSTERLGLRETVTLWRSADGGVTYTIPVINGGSGSNTLLSSSNNTAVIEGPGFFQIRKSETGGNTAILTDT